MAIRRRRSAAEEEKMTDTNLLRVINLLEPTEEGVSPITKKDACAMLGMTYNTTRLNGIVTEFKERREREKKRRAEKRGKPATNDEVCYIIQEYLKGENVDALSKSLYRSTTFVKNVFAEFAVPMRSVNHSYFKPELIPEGAYRDRFVVGEVVYSIRYDSLAEIRDERFDPRYGWIYHVWLASEHQQQFAFQPAYDLASLQHLRNIGVKV